MICIISLFDILFVFIQSAVCKEKIKGPKDFDVFFSAQLKSFGAKLKHLCVVTFKMAAAVHLYCLLFKGKRGLSLSAQSVSIFKTQQQPSSIVCGGIFTKVLAK